MSNVLAFRQRPTEAKPSVRGYALLHRKIRELPFYRQDSEAVHLWLHFILAANYQPTFAQTEMGEMLVKRGQFIAGRNQLAADTGISPDRVKYLINKFVKMGMITTQSSRKFTVITIEKYDDYQANFVPSECQQSATANADVARLSAEGVPADCQQSATSNKYNNNTVISNDITGTAAAENSQARKSPFSCQDVLDAYHQILPEAPRVRLLTDKRRNQIRTFWKHATKTTRTLDGHPFTLDDWKAYLGYIAENCRWMLEDRADNRFGKTWRKKPFEYFLKPDVYVEVREGIRDDN